ncbi:MAG: exodeoxyribonuclease VII small subunit [Candidatus Bipolaricaulaceae bacterium]
MGPSDRELSYTEAVTRLDEILNKIEEGQVDIDQLSSLVQEAAELVALCREKIQAAEVQVKTITERLEREADLPAGPAEGEGDQEDQVPF